MGGTRVYVYGLLHRSGFCEEVKGIYLSSDDTAHMRSNTENFCVGPFYRWESKVTISFAAGFVLWQSKVDTYGANMKYMIIVYTMLNSSGEFPNPAFGIGNDLHLC